MANDALTPADLPPSAEPTDAFLRSKGYAPRTAALGYQLAEHRCSTTKCRADRYQFKFEISVGHTAPFRVKSSHVRCDRCDQLYELTVTEDDQGGHVRALPFVD